MATKQSTDMSYDTKTILVVLLLLFFYPLGIVFMWMWMMWPKWLKILLTLLMILPILMIFAAISLIAINPARQFDRANDTKRMSDVSALQNAIAQYEVTNGVLPEGITEQSMEIAKNGADVCAALVPTEIAALPTDPDSAYAGANILAEDCSSDYSTGYYVAINDMGEVVVTAPNTTE